MGEYAEDLASGTMLPVGTVEFVREAMRIAEIIEPPNLTYPTALQPFLLRRVWRSRISELSSRRFVKSCSTKAFTGFVLDLDNPDSMDIYDKEEHEALKRLDPSTEVWVSDPVKFLSEWRYYIQGGKVVGRGRYDSGPEELLVPDMNVVQAAVVAYRSLQPYTLDFGVLVDGTTALVEVNDAWAIGLYERALSNGAYLRFLWERWSGIYGWCTMPPAP